MAEQYTGVAHATRLSTVAMFHCWLDLYLGDGTLPEAA